MAFQRLLLIGPGRLCYPPARVAKTPAPIPQIPEFPSFSLLLYGAVRPSAMPDFRIQIERLTDRPTSFEFEVAPAWWRVRDEPIDGDAVVVEAPFQFRLQASRVSDDVVIDGAFSGEVGLECSRCGKRYPHALRESYRLVLQPLGGRAPDPEGEKGLAENGVCLGEDLEAGSYRGAVVGLDDFFGEVIALAMPLQPLCDEDCPGLCAHCGAAQDAGCDCEDEKIESPFSALAGLKAQLASKASEEQ